MGFFDFFRLPDINQGVNAYRQQEGAVLLDVRTPQEYRNGFIPGSQNVPLQAINTVGSVVEKKDTALYVYCHSGSRSRQAVSILQRMGYTNVTDICGFAAYRGKVASV